MRLSSSVLLTCLLLLATSGGAGAEGTVAAGGSVVAAAAGAADPGRVYLSIDYQKYDTFLGAVHGSIAPTSVKANTGAVLRNTVDPLNPLKYLTAVVGLEVQKQIASGNGLNVKEVLDKLDPKGLALGYLGSQAGELVGAAAQSVMAKAFGPIGGFAGFTLRPILWLVGSNVGMEAGKNLGKGGNPLKGGLSVALTEYNPTQDTLQMIGDNIGGVIGQALIPIPLLGNIVGGVVGGVAGVVIAKGITATQAGRSLDKTVRERFKELAASITGRPVANGIPEGYVAVPVIASGGRRAGDAPLGDEPRLMEVVPEGSTPASRQQEMRQAYRQVVEASRSGDTAAAASSLEAYSRTKSTTQATP